MSISDAIKVIKWECKYGGMTPEAELKRVRRIAELQRLVSNAMASLSNPVEYLIEVDYISDIRKRYDDHLKGRD